MSCMDFELSISACMPGKIDHNLECCIEHMSDPVILNVAAVFKVSQIYVFSYVLAVTSAVILLTLSLRRFFISFRGHGNNCLQTFTWHGLYAIFNVWHEFFSLVFMFHRLRIEAPSLSTVHGKCI